MTLSTEPHDPPKERRTMMRREEDRERYFSIPQVLLICAFVAALASLSGWVLNIEIRKADRSEIIGKSAQDGLNMRLSAIETELRYIRVRVDEHMLSTGRQ